MIEISSTTAFMIYLCLTLGPLLGLWLVQHYSKRHSKINVEEHQLYICEYCQFCYLDDRVQGITRCPQCLSYNKKEKK